MGGEDELKEVVKQSITSYSDFPKPGVLFRDVFAITRNPAAFRVLQKLLLDHIRTIDPPPQLVVALEARGFLIGPIIALQMNIPFVPIRKKGKLPGQTHKVSYCLEYGMDVLELQVGSIEDGQCVIIVDDLLATGGSLNAACNLIEKSGGCVMECIVIMELLDLKGRDAVKYPLYSIVQF